MGLQELIQTIKPADAKAYEACVARYNAVAKPVGSLGKLEELLERVAAVYGDPCVDIRKKCVLVFCGDNGVQCRCRCGDSTAAANTGTHADQPGTIFVDLEQFAEKHPQTQPQYDTDKGVEKSLRTGGKHLVQVHAEPHKHDRRTQKLAGNFAGDLAERISGTDSKNDPGDDCDPGSVIAHRRNYPWHKEKCQCQHHKSNFTDIFFHNTVPFRISSAHAGVAAEDLEES